MKSVHHHASVVIIESKEGGEFLFGIYSKIYPKVLYRGRANLIGGNHSIKDNSPYDVLKRELEEEFVIKQKKEKEIEENLIDIIGKKSGFEKTKKFAAQEDIKNIKEGILKSKVPFRDFLVKIPSLEGSKSFSAVMSVFLSKLPSDIFWRIKENIRNGEEITCEGSVAIVSLNNLKSGKVLTAWGTSQIIEFYTKTKIPNPEGVKAIPLGFPKKSFSDYLGDFHYETRIKYQT